MAPRFDDSPASASAAAPPPVGQPAPTEFTAPLSGASHRLRALAALSGSLTDALDPGEAARLVETKALSALGASSAVVVTLGRFPSDVVSTPVVAEPPAAPRLYVVHAVGLPAELKAALDELPLAAPVPLAEVARMGEPLFLASESELRRYPQWGAAMIAAGTAAAAIVPVWANGELRGVLGLTWAMPRAFDEDERAFVLTLGVMCAQAIMRSYLRAAESHARHEAERANLFKAQFLTMISHELRTPMNAVMGYTSLLADELSGPVTLLQRHQLGRMRDSGQHVLGLVEELLSYARVDAGRDVVRAENVLLSDVVEQSLTIVRTLADRKGLRLHVEGIDRPIAMYTDPGKFRQILVNLLANAVKFSDRGEVVVLLEVEGEEQEMRVQVRVSDDGRGIALKDHEHVFEAFWQDDPTHPDPAGGTGLGLPLARQLARLLGGDVSVFSSAPGHGSIFLVSLPARYVERAAPAGGMVVGAR